MKKLIGLVVIIAALVLGGYYGMGLVTERTLKKNVAIINQSNCLFVDVGSSSLMPSSNDRIVLLFIFL